MCSRHLITPKKNFFNPDFLYQGKHPILIIRAQRRMSDHIIQKPYCLSKKQLPPKKDYIFTSEYGIKSCHSFSRYTPLILTKTINFQQSATSNVRFLDRQYTNNIMFSLTRIRLKFYYFQAVSCKGLDTEKTMVYVQAGR